MHEQTLVSIIIPTYNRAHLIGETLDSVLAQTYTHWECIVVDDGSTDRTDKLMAEYVAKDSRFQYHHRSKDRLKGANACRNYGFELSQGEYIQWLDSDDLLGKAKIESQLLLLEKEAFNSLAFCKWQIFKGSVDENSTLPKNPNLYISHNSISSFLKALGHSEGYLPPHTYLMSSELVRKAGKWNEDLIINQDGDFFIRVLSESKNILYSEEARAFYRIGNSFKTSEFSSKIKAVAAVESWKIIIRDLSPVERYLFRGVLFTNIKNLKSNLSKKYPEIISQNNLLFKNYSNKRLKTLTLVSGIILY
tara:strand:- start:40 stop:957 length:918 start_codon:yes stop_codon:yes gene_type:complete